MPPTSPTSPPSPLASPEIQIVSNQEQAWNEWLLSLEPWDRHSIFPHELEWLDNLLSGAWEWEHVMQAFSEVREARHAPC